MARAVRLRIADGKREIMAIAPSVNDLIVAKLARLDEKDKRFVAACHDSRPLDVARLLALIDLTELDEARKRAAKDFLGRLMPQA